MSDASVYGLIGLTEESVGLDRRIYTGLTSTDPTLAVSYNSGRVDVFLNGVKLVGDHSEMPSGTKDYTFTATGQGSSITLATGVALVSSDVVEVMGYVSNSANTVTTYNYTATASQVAFTANNSSGDLVNVFLNGVLLDSSDYNLTTANTVTLSSDAAVNDIVHIQVIGALDNSNFVPAGGGTFSGNVVFSGNTTGVDVNGTELVLDEDGDTSITADTDDQIDFRAGGTDSVKIGNEHLTINDGNLVIGTAGHGITFGGDPDTRQNSPNTGDRTLYDYEEGYFTVTTTDDDGSSSNGLTFDSSANTLSYTKIGRVVYIQGRLGFSHTGTGTNGFLIKNLPFTLGTTATLPEKSFHPNFIITFSSLNSAINEHIYAYFSSGTNLRIRDGGNGVDNGQDLAGHIDNGTNMFISGFYFVD